MEEAATLGGAGCEPRACAGGCKPTWCTGVEGAPHDPNPNPNPSPNPNPKPKPDQVWKALHMTVLTSPLHDMARLGPGSNYYSYSPHPVVSTHHSYRLLTTDF